jgi:predicted dehydrogenase
MNYETPKSVTGRLLNASSMTGSPKQVPTEFSGEVLFEKVSASFYCSFLTEHQQLAHLSGNKGNLRVDDFVLPYYGNRLGFTASNSIFDCDVCDFRMERRETYHQVEEYASSHPSAQESNLFRTFSDLALSGQPDPHWPKITRLTQKLMMSCMESAEQGGTELSWS